MRFIRSTEGPQVRDRVPTTLAAHDAIKAAALKAVEHDDIRTDEAGNIELELSPAELIAEHTGRIEHLHRDQHPVYGQEVVSIGNRRKSDRRTVTHDDDGAVWAPIDKLAELLGIAVELDAGGQHLLAARIRAALTNSELSAKYRAALDQLAG